MNKDDKLPPNKDAPLSRETQVTPDQNKEIKILDLFSGTGAFSLAFDSFKSQSDVSQCINFNSVCSNDIEKSSEVIYKANFPDSNFILKDIHDIDVSNISVHNILCGGFPCQPFSIAGLQKGFDDTRSNVFWKILEILTYHKPEIFILENVKNLKSHDKGNTYKVIIENLMKLNYHVKSSILDTSKITNVPQHRERIYIIGFLDKQKYDNFHFYFLNQPNLPIKQFLENTDDIPEKYYYSDKYNSFNIVRDGVTKTIDENVLYQLRRGYIRENKSNCCPTMTANMGGGGHNVPLLKDERGIRKLTPRECFNLQGFPSKYTLPTNLSDSALYKLAGNAVSVPVVKLIVDKLSKLFE